MHPIVFGKIQVTFRIAYKVSIKMYMFQRNEQRFLKVTLQITALKFNLTHKMNSE